MWIYQALELILGKINAKHTVHFIGHGGAKVAEYVKQNLFSHLLRHPKFISDTKVAIGIGLFSFHNSLDVEFCV